MSFTSVLHWFKSIWLWLLSKLGSLDAAVWYSFLCACVFAIWVLYYGMYRVFNSKWPLTTSFVMRHLVYPHIFPRIRFLGTATRLKVLILFLYLLANTLFVTVVKSRADMGSRAATMSIINLIPLLCGPRLSLMTKLLGISLRASVGSHQWFGRTAIAQMLLHTVISLTGSTAFTWTANNLSGVIVCSAPTPARCSLTFITGKLCFRIHLYPFDSPREACVVRMVPQFAPAPNCRGSGGHVAPPFFEKAGRVFLANRHMPLGYRDCRSLGFVCVEEFCLRQANWCNSCGEAAFQHRLVESIVS